MHVQSLSQELYDLIYEFTFTSEPGVREIGTTYKTPGLLHVDQASRHIYGESYYGGRTFHISTCDAKDYTQVNSRCYKWLRSLPKPQLEMIHSIRCDRPCITGQSEWEMVRISQMLASVQLRQLEGLLQRHYVRVPEDVLEVKVLESQQGEEKPVWVSNSCV